MRRLLLSLLAALLALPVMVLTAPAAQACSCAVSSPSRLVERAALVAQVEVVARDEHTSADGMAGSRYDVVVRREWKGPGQQRVAVVSRDDSASCGVRLAVGREYLLLGTRAGDAWRVDLCGGTTALAPGTPQGAVTVADVKERLGAGTTPAAASPSPEQATTTSAGAGGPGESVRGDDRGWWAPAGGVVGLLLASLLVVLVGRRLARRAG